MFIKLVITKCVHFKLGSLAKLVVYLQTVALFMKFGVTKYPFQCFSSVSPKAASKEFYITTLIRLGERWQKRVILRKLNSRNASDILLSKNERFIK